MSGTRICFGEWVQRIIPLIGVDDVNFASQYDKVCEYNCVGDVLVFIPGNSRSCSHAPFGEAGDDPYDILITEAP